MTDITRETELLAKIATLELSNLELKAMLIEKQMEIYEQMMRMITDKIPLLQQQRAALAIEIDKRKPNPKLELAK
jgi:hypothetical protein